MAQSIPLNPLAQLHLSFALQVPSFRHWTLSSQVKSGHNPSTNATPPGQGVTEKVGLPLNTYKNYHQLFVPIANFITVCILAN